MGEVLFDQFGLTMALSDDGIVVSTVHGAQNLPPDEADVLFEGIRAVMAAQAPVLHLLDGRGINVDSLAMRWKLAQHMNRQRALIKKSAVVSDSATTRTLGSVVVRTSGRTNVRFFRTVEEAKAWLLDEHDLR